MQQQINKKDIICNACGGNMKYHENEEILIPVGDDKKDEIRKIEKAIEKRFLKIRGWKDWKEYDRVGENTELDKNLRKELINISIKETLKNATNK